ncbi:MAG: hypothetical protein NVSMB51_05940 [Solirubrobacteraceae bacterium]
MKSVENGELLIWASRLGAVSAADVGLRFGISECAARGRLGALAAAGLLSHSRLLHRRPALWLATRAGLRAAGLSGLEPCRVSAAGFEHALACSALAARLELAGSEVCGERELRLREREAGHALASAELGFGPDGERALHRPDLVVWRGPRALAIELELTVKAPLRLRRIVRGWARSRRVDGVLYLCTPAPARAVRRAIELEQAGGMVWALKLADERADEFVAKFSRGSKSCVPSRA